MDKAETQLSIGKTHSRYLPQVMKKNFYSGIHKSEKIFSQDFEKHIELLNHKTFSTWKCLKLCCVAKTYLMHYRLYQQVELTVYHGDPKPQFSERPRRSFELVLRKNGSLLLRAHPSSLKGTSSRMEKEGVATREKEGQW